MNFLNAVVLSSIFLLMPAISAAQSADRIAEYEKSIAEQQLDPMRKERDELEVAVARQQPGTQADQRVVAEAEAPAKQKLVRSKNENLAVQFNGRVYRMFLNVDDGTNTATPLAHLDILEKHK
jgi:hypothetical protein